MPGVSSLYATECGPACQIKIADSKGRNIGLGLDADVVHRDGQWLEMGAFWRYLVLWHEPSET
jgi:hypothetical protein